MAISINYSDIFLKTLREDPNDADTKGYKLLIRAGYIKPVGAGLFEWLPLGLKVLRKVENIVREEMDAIGASEVLLPALLPKEPYEITNRFEEYGPNLFRLKDRKGSDYLLAPTHEEMFTLLAKSNFSSHKDLPTSLYQIQTKYRDEARPRAGLIRAREFIMKDSYSFDLTEDGLNKSYDKHREAYIKIFKRIGLEVVPVSAQSGAMGGSRSEEFLHPNQIGEDTFIRTDTGYNANVEAFNPLIPNDIDYKEVPNVEEVNTPNTKTIEELSNFFNTDKSKFLKSVVNTAVHPTGERQLVISLMRGDRDLDIKRLEANLSPLEIEETTDEDFKNNPSIIPGFIGPNINSEGFDNILFVLDSSIAKGESFITGANKKDYHNKNVVIGRDFKPSLTLGIIEVKDGDIAFDGSEISIERGIEMGHIFALGQKYSKSFDFKVQDENGQNQTVWMGSYGVGVSRIIAALSETYNDEFGLIWPSHLAPFDYYIIEANDSDEVLEMSKQLQNKLNNEGKDVLVDNRAKVSIGVKFKDSELLGIPKTIVIGKLASEGKYELKDRKSGEKTIV